MANIAAVLPAVKAPIELHEVETYTPGPLDLLVKNELITLLPVDAKIAKIGMSPAPTPAILGINFGGTVEAIGSEVTDFKIGDKVAGYAPRTPDNRDKVNGNSLKDEKNKYGAFQRYVLARDVFASKVSNSSDLVASVNILGNSLTMVGLLTGRIGLEKPDLNSQPPKRNQKILIYGGSSSCGSIGVQYAAQAGYAVVTTTSPKNEEFVSKLGATKVVDHTQETGKLIEALKAEGPYEAVIDTIAIPSTIKVTGGVLAAQGGGTVFGLIPLFGPEAPPDGVNVEFNSWHLSLSEGKYPDLQKWAVKSYLPEGIASGKIIPLRTEMVSGGLGGLNETLDLLLKGVSCVRLAIDPWE